MVSSAGFEQATISNFENTLPAGKKNFEKIEELKPTGGLKILTFR